MTLPEQPYAYRQRELVEPDWTRLPGWAHVTPAEWAEVQWQRAHCVKNVRQLHDVMGDLLTDGLLRRPRTRPGERATMSMLVPPQMLNTMVPSVDGAPAAGPPTREPSTPTRSAATCCRSSPTAHRLAVAPARHPRQPARARHVGRRGADPPVPHQGARRAAPTCPQYCGHCTRMDLVGNSTPQVDKLKLAGKPVDRYAAMLAYLSTTPQVRDVVVSGGDVANMPWKNLEAFLDRLLEIDNIRDIPAGHQGADGAAPALAGARRRRGRGPGRDQGPRARRLAGHPHPRQRGSVGDAARSPRRPGRCCGRACATSATRASSCAASTTRPSSCSTCASRCSDDASITPYYFYMCDMIPFAEHWRVSLKHAQELQHAIMG